MNTEYLDSLISRTRKAINRWRGRNAAMLELTKSHRTLSVIVFGDTYGENLVLYCIAPEYVCGPTDWSDSKIRIERSTLKSGASGIALVDAVNGVQVRAESFEIKENVKV